MNDDLTPVIIAGARTPFGKFRGALSSVQVNDLGAHAIKAALERSGVPAEKIGHVILGQVILAGAGQGPARQASIKAGISYNVPTVTINKLCLSGLTAVIDAARMIRCGEAEFIVAAGQESMSNAPHLVRGMRTGLAIGDRGMEDSLNHDGLADPFTGELMGSATDRGNQERHIPRAEQDAFAAASHQRAAAARQALNEEIAPISIAQRHGEDIVVSQDEGIRPETTVEQLAALRPAFSKDPQATITAGSSSPLSDGAAALVIASKGAARKAGLSWLCEIGAHGQTAGPDGSLHSQPSSSILVALAKEGLQPTDLDLIEINEAFASVVLQSAKDLGVDPAVINREGGAIALGHPVGASGTRLALHQTMELARRGSGVGVVSLCGGGGQGDALILRV